MYKEKCDKKCHIIGRNRLEKQSFIVLMLVMLFPLIDYLLRDLLSVPILSSLWDELILLIGLLLAFYQWVDKKHRTDTSINNAILLFFLLGIALIILDITTVSINIEGFRAIYQYILFFYIGYYLIRDFPQARIILSAAVILGALIGLYGIYQYIVGVPMPGRWADSAENIRTRAFSILGSPNILGTHMAALIPISFSLFLGQKNWSIKIFWLVLTGVMGGALLFTLSRGAWLALVGALGLMGIIYNRKILIVGIIVAILAGIFVPAVNQRMTYLFSKEYIEKSSKSGRIDRWLKAYDQMRQEPLLGVGLGHFGGAVAKRHYDSIYADNYYMKTLAEMGLLGLGLFVYLIIIVLRKGFNSWKSLKDPPQRYLAAGILTGLLVIALHNGVENVFEEPYITTYFWMLSGFLLALPQLSGGVEDE